MAAIGQVTQASKKADDEDGKRSFENLFCDIIAQQQEFQLRQESRVGQNLASIRARTRRIQEQKEKLEEEQWRESPDRIDSSEFERARSVNEAKSQRRKFSLSYAMSSLASLTSQTSSSSQAVGDRTTRHQNPNSNPNQLERRKQLQHRASLVSGELVGEKNEKKRGFVHKAIRRGSKMFDSIVMQSEQRHSQEPSCQTADEVAGQPAEGRNWRKRKLTLGSLPSDLRRALSFSSSAHSQQQQQQKSQHKFSHLTRSVGSTSRANDEANESEFADTSTARIAIQSGERLRRKNSLFSALSSVSPANLVARSLSREQQQQHSSQTSPKHRAAQLASSQNVSLSLGLDHSRTYKLIIFGSSAVGKTSLIQRFLYGQFPVAHKPTVEELHSNKYNIPGLGEIYLEILDTSGTFEFPAMRQLSIEKGDAFILVFSACDQDSWREVIHLRQMILEQKGENSLARAQPSPERAKMGRGSIEGANRKSAEEEPSNADSIAPISSIYAAAARLTSMNRRASCVPSQMKAVGASSRRVSICGGASEGGQKDSGASDEIIPPTCAHYNDQLSRLIQQTPACHTSGRLLDSTASVDERESGILMGDEREEQQVKGETTNANHGHNKSSLGNSESQSSGSQSDESRDERRRHDSRRVMLEPSKDPSKRGVAGEKEDMEKEREREREREEEEQELERQEKDREKEEQEEKQEDLEMFRRISTPIVVVANKCDLVVPMSELENDLEEAERLVRDQWASSFVRCSAKEGENIDRVFRELLRQAQAPESLSQFVIDDNQQRRQSLPVLKNQLSVNQMKGLRNLYSQQQQQVARQRHPVQQNPYQQQQTTIAHPQSQTSGRTQNCQTHHEQPANRMSSSCANDDNQCRII